MDGGLLKAENFILITINTFNLTLKTDLIQWLKENIGDDAQIFIPPFERLVKREFEHIPNSEQEFRKIISDAPSNILKGFGFEKWDTMNNLIKEGSVSMKPLEIDEDIWLFPYEWYGVIPNRFVVTNLWGRDHIFEQGVSSNNARYGCLCYGFRRAILPTPVA